VPKRSGAQLVLVELPLLLVGTTDGSYDLDGAPC
jgi:hypothetical protein